jgi:hypothetical protein
VETVEEPEPAPPATGGEAKPEEAKASAPANDPAIETGSAADDDSKKKFSKKY